MKFASETNGSLALSEVFSGDGSIQMRIDDGIIKVDEAQGTLNSWWESLSPLEQANPVNQAKYQTASIVLSRAGEVLHAADVAASNISSSTVQYSMDKQVKDPWNFIVGAQYQYNKHWMVRLETGFLGSRNQIMGGLQYRFGL